MNEHEMPHPAEGQVELALRLIEMIGLHLDDHYLLLRKRVAAVMEYLDDPYGVTTPNVHTVEHVKRYLNGDRDNELTGIDTSEPVEIPHFDQLEHFTASPERIDEYLRDHLDNDRRLAFYQWIGAHAVRELLTGLRKQIGDDPVPVEHRGYTPSDVDEFLDWHDPNQEGAPYPSVLPLGTPWCDVPHHIHTDGGSRLPTCRLDSAE